VLPALPAGLSATRPTPADAPDVLAVVAASNTAVLGRPDVALSVGGRPVLQTDVWRRVLPTGAVPGTADGPHYFWPVWPIGFMAFEVPNHRRGMSRHAPR